MKKIVLTVFLSVSAAWAQMSDAPAEQTEQKGPDFTKLPFTPDSIRRVVMHYQPKVMACYEEMLASRDKPIEGVLMTWFVIDAEGVVSKAKIQKKGTTLKDKDLNDCVLGVLSEMQFPKPPDGNDVPVEFPFNLKAVHE